MTVSRDMRHTKVNRCGVCGGADGDPRGKEKRCHGFTTEDGWCHCSREELAGAIEAGPDGLFSHRMHGPCNCGQTHGEALSGTTRAVNDVEATYDYRDERGNLLFQVVRKTGKRFLQRRPHGDDWIYQVGDVRRVPYRLPQLLAADPARTVYIVEGEKDVESLERAGELATCNPGGAGKWRFVADEAARALSGRVVVVVADADGPGREHANAVSEALKGVAKSVRVVEPPSPHKDVTDCLLAGLRMADVAPPLPSRFRIISAPALAKPLPPVEWLCEGYALPRGCYALIAGESYSGKSLWITDLALAIATGKSAMGLHRAEKGRVLWLDYDGQGERITRTRLQRMARANGYDLAEIGDNFGYAWLPDARLDDPDAFDEFARVLDGVSFVVIDSWRGAAPNTEEKDRGAVQKVAHTIFKLIEKTGVTPMIVDHTIKPSREGKSTRSAMHDIHGSSAKAEAAQWVVIFEKQEDKPVMVRHTKERAGARTMEPFGLEYLDIAENGDPRWGLRVRHMDKAEMEVPNDLIDQMKRKLLTTIRQSRGKYTSANQIAAAVGGRKGTVLEALRQLMADEDVYQQGEDGPFRVAQMTRVRGG